MIPTLSTLIVAASILMPHPAPTPLQRQVAAVLAGEARGEKWDGLLAVAQVIRNRAQHRPGDWRGNVLEVITKPCAFSCVSSTRGVRATALDLERLALRMERLAGWSDAVAVAGLLERDPRLLGNSVRGATHYHAPMKHPPGWAQVLERVAVVGRHTFYREGK